MQLAIIQFGLVLVTFYELIFKMFPNVEVLSANTRDHKSMLSMCLALSIGFIGITTGSIRKCSNIWIPIFILFTFLSIILAPHYTFVVNSNDSSNFWVWKPSLMMVAYFLMFMSVQSMNINRDDLDKLFKTMMYCGLAMALYVLVQNYFSDQFYNTKPRELIGTVTKASVVGTLGNSTLVSPYIGMLVPFALMYKKFIYAGLMIWAVIVCDSAVATVAFGLSMLLFIALSSFKWRWLVVGMVILASCGGLFFLRGTQYFNSNGRLGVWQQIPKDMMSMEFGEKNMKPYFITGIGPEGYSYIYAEAKKTIFRQAHNEPLEVFVNYGFVGLTLFLIACAHILKDIFTGYLAARARTIYLPVMTAFVLICLCSLGTFIFQVSPHNFYAVFLLGLLYNHQIKEI